MLKFKLLLMCACALLLNACTAMDKTSTIVMDPDVQVGSEESQTPSKVTLSFYANQDVNENFLGEGTPVDFHVVYLRDDSKVLSADFDELMYSLEESLGQNYVTHDDFSLIPGQYKYIESAEIEKGVRYIAVLARFSEPNATQWKRIVRVKNTGFNYKFLLQFKRDKVDFIKEVY